MLPKVILHLIVEYADYDVITRFLEDHENYLSWEHLSGNPSIPYSFLARKQSSIDQYNLCTNPTAFYSPEAVEVLQRNINSISWWHVCANPSVPPSFFESNVKNLCWLTLCSNPGVPLSFFQKNIDKVDRGGYWINLCRNPGIPISFFEENEDKIDYCGISGNPSIGLDFFLGRTSQGVSRENKIDWFYLVGNPSIPMEFFRKNREKIKTWWRLSENPSLTPDFIEENINDVSIARSTAKLPLSFLEKHIDRLESHWNILCRNPHVPISFLWKKKHDIDWHAVLRYSDHIDPNFIRENARTIDWKPLSENSLFFSKVAREELLTLLIEIL